MIKLKKNITNYNNLYKNNITPQGDNILHLPY